MSTASIQSSSVTRAQAFTKHELAELQLGNLNTSRLIPAPESDQDSALSQYVLHLAKNMARQTLTWHAMKTMLDNAYYRATSVRRTNTSTLIGFASRDGKRIIHYDNTQHELEIQDCPTNGLVTEFSACNVGSRSTVLKVARPNNRTSCLLIKRQEHDYVGIIISTLDTTGGFVFRDDPFGTDLEGDMVQAFQKFPKELGQQHICQDEAGAWQLRYWLMN